MTLYKFDKPSGPGFVTNTLIQAQGSKHQNPLILKKSRCPSVRKIPFCSRKNESINSAREQKSRAHRLSLKYTSARQSPPLLDPLHWINLSNGAQVLEMLPTHLISSNAIRFTRIQSSHCEASAFDKVLWCIDNDLLLSLAVGRPCYVYDLASRNKLLGVSRALFLGLQFVRWSLAYLWFAADRPNLVPERVLVRGKNAVPYWRDTVIPFQIGKDTKKRLRYFAPFAREMGTTDVRLYGVSGPSTELDGCISVHTKFVRQWLESAPMRDTKGYGTNTFPDMLRQHALALYDNETTMDGLYEVQRSIHEKMNESSNEHIETTQNDCK